MIKNHIKRFIQDKSGVISIEFAFFLPFMLFVYFAGSYVSAAVTIHKKLNTLAGDINELSPYPRESALQSCFKNIILSGMGKELVKQGVYPFPVSNNYEISFKDINYSTSDAIAELDAANINRYVRVEITYDFMQGMFLSGFLPDLIKESLKLRVSSPHIILKTGPTLNGCPEGDLRLKSNLPGGAVVDNLEALPFDVSYGDGEVFRLQASGGSGTYKYSSQNALPVGITLLDDGRVQMFDAMFLSSEDQLIRAFQGVFRRLPDVEDIRKWETKRSEGGWSFKELLSNMMNDPSYSPIGERGVIEDTVIFEVRDSSGETDYMTVGFKISIN